MNKNIEDITIGKDDWVFQEWDQGDYLYLIRSGLIGLYKRVSGVDVKIAELTAGEVFGEMSVISGKPRSAGAVAMIDSELTKVSRGVIRKRFNESGVYFRLGLLSLFQHLNSPLFEAGK